MNRFWQLQCAHDGRRWCLRHKRTRINAPCEIVIEGESRTELEHDGSVRQLRETTQRRDAEEMQAAQHLGRGIGQRCQRQCSQEGSLVAIGHDHDPRRSVAWRAAWAAVNLLEAHAAQSI